MVSSFGITVLESGKSKEIDLCSDYAKQALTLVAIISVWISLQTVTSYIVASCATTKKLNKL